ncbi:Drebrin [Bagarius yarrelli]|uniref:Drebrin n=1 Tax=Bagarius yarrelli TaxID=175774 RepID=A0A556U860_BAGYA|nr:Drebrin [Bagarius yarrelli]
MQAINLDTFSLSLLTAKEDILNGRASTDWALFAYDGFTNNLKLFDSGTGGFTELAQKFHSARPMYGLCRITSPEGGQPQIVLICWVGEDVEEFRRTECADHVPAVKNFFKEAHAFISASNKDELTEEKIAEILAKVRPSMGRFRKNSRPTEKEETVGTNYRKTNPLMEMRRINRDSFWARAEREEEERKEEEKRKAAEERRRLERERVMQERKEAEERDRKMNEKLQMIEEQRRLDAKHQEESRRQEKARWMILYDEQDEQQREHQEEMRARLRRSESIEKAAEAAVLISQRSMNPREFFRQLSQSSTSPVSPHTGKPPFRRYQRSLTDTAFIFEKASASSGPTSPLSPSVTSPFSRTPTSPFNRCMSPTSPGFRPIVSPRSFHTPVRTSPTSLVQCSAPSMSSAPSLPESKADLPAGQETDSVFERKSTSEERNAVIEQKTMTVPDAPSAPLPDNPVPSNDSVSKLLIDTFMPDGIEEELDIIVGPERQEAQLPLEACTSCLPATETFFSSQDPAEAEEAVAFAVSALIEEDEDIEEEEPEQEEKVCVEDDERPDQNGVCPKNGTAKDYDETSDHSTSEKYTYIVNREETEEEDAQSEEAENGEASDRPLIRVRALYDYQAEDDTEISFEPGDIIIDVETVDKAWWRGFSKDGRQGLFPSNYVETI